MISLVLYILSFIIIIGVVASVTTFFNNNIRDLNNTVSTSSEYNKYNVYMLEYTKNGYEFGSIDDHTIKFSKNGVTEAKFTFVDNTLYYNKIKLCENIENFEYKMEEENGKQVLRTLIQINDTVYTTDYVVE